MKYRRIGQILLIVWVACALYWVSLLHGGHLLRFSVATQPDSFASFVNANSNWTLIHIFAPACRCSEFLIEELQSRNPLPGVHEVIVTLGPLPAAEPLRAKGYEIVQKTINELSETEKVIVEGVPFFVVVRRDHTLLYAGGYSGEKIGPQTQLQYLDIVAKLQQGESVESLGIQGCAVSEKYQRMLNPFGLRITKDDALSR